MRVLIGTDGSDDAVAAASAGLALLASPAYVTLVCVVDAPRVATAGMESGFAGGIATDQEVDQAWAVVDEEADEVLARTAARFDPSLQIDTVIRQGEAGAVLCRIAEEVEADAIIVGSRGRGAIKRAVLGSVSAHVSNNAPCPVVIVRAGADD